MQLLYGNGPVKKLHELRREDNLHEKSYFKWVQLIDSIPERWKSIFKENYEYATNMIIYDHHLIKGSRVITLDKLIPTKIYYVLISKFRNKASPNIHFKNPFSDYTIDWTALYMLAPLVTYITLIPQTVIFGNPYSASNNSIF